MRGTLGRKGKSVVQLGQPLTARGPATPLPVEQDWDYVYTTTFTGQGGATLAEDVGLEASYRVRGDEGYVRATVTSSYGTKAWTQPLWLQ